MATPMMWLRQPDTIGVLGLALNACDSRSNGHLETIADIRELLGTAQVLWTEAMEHDDKAERVSEIRAAFRLIHLADILSVTSPA